MHDSGAIHSARGDVAAVSGMIVLSRLIIKEHASSDE